MDIREVNFEEHGLEIGRLRAQVWIATGERKAEQFPDGIWHDEIEKCSHHWAGFAQGMIVASARLTIGKAGTPVPYSVFLLTHDDVIGVFSRMVVASEFQGHGVARDLDLQRIRKARECGATQVFGVFPVRRIERLLAIGFRVIKHYSAEEFHRLDAGHYAAATMVMNLQ